MILEDAPMPSSYVIIPLVFVCLHVLKIGNVKTANLQKNVVG